MTTNIDNANPRINFVNSSSKKEITSSVSNQLQTCERVDPAATELPSIQELAPYNIEWMSPELAEKISDFTSNILNKGIKAECEARYKDGFIINKFYVTTYVEGFK